MKLADSPRTDALQMDVSCAALACLSLWFRPLALSCRLADTYGKVFVRASREASNFELSCRADIAEVLSGVVWVWS
jgi:hypothetical protein